MAHSAALISLMILLPVIIGVAYGTSEPRIFNLKEGEPCPAEYFKLDCNSCTCKDGKTAMCTLMGCPPVNIPSYMDPMLCPAGKQFTSDSKTCNCNEDGKSATCK